MTLYFVRHGQTDLNKNHILQGKSIDEPINATGVSQIENILQELPRDFEVIYSSPHKRVLQSAEIISNFSGKPIIVKKEIEERDFGSLTGKYWTTIPNGEELHQLDRNQLYDYRPFGGESVDDVTDRINSFIDIAKSSGYKVAMVVTSIGILRLFYKIMGHKGVIDIPNGSIHKFEI